MELVSGGDGGGGEMAVCRQGGQGELVSASP